MNIILLSFTIIYHLRSIIRNLFLSHFLFLISIFPRRIFPYSPISAASAVCPLSATAATTTALPMSLRLPKKVNAAPATTTATKPFRNYSKS